MDAELVIRFRNVLPDGGIAEAVIWRQADPLAPSKHWFKYRLAYVVDGKRVIGFHNERGKGDHKHVGDKEYPYTFIDVDRLVDDFMREVKK